ncbi:MAG: ABC transporter substrate-binding protein [Janthinobacterium lividum]
MSLPFGTIMNVKRFARTFLASTALLALHAIPALAEDNGKNIVNVAMVPNYPPFEFKDPATDQLKGFDVDLGVALAKQMGMTLDWQETSFDQMMSALKTGRADLILSGMTDLPARRESVDFIDYIKTGPQFYALKANRAAFPAEAALCGKKVGASRRTSFVDDIRNWSAAHCEKAGLPPVIAVGTDGSSDARLQLRQGRLDAAVQGGETLPYQNSIDGDAYFAIGQPFLSQYTGIAVEKSNTALRDAVIKALAKLMADGGYRTILAKWQLQEHAVPRVVVNSAD